MYSNKRLETSQGRNASALLVAANATGIENEVQQVDNQALEKAEELILYMADMEKKRLHLVEQMQAISSGQYHGTMTQKSLEKQELELVSHQDQIKQALDSYGLPPHMSKILTEKNLGQLARSIRKDASEPTRKDIQQGSQEDTPQPKVKPTIEPTSKATVE